jgi:arylsulfatase A-like enzyme
MMIRYPKRIKPGTVCNEMVLDLDIAPTLLDLAGVAAPQHMQGKSMLPLADKPDPNFRKEWYYEYYEWPNFWGVRPNRGIRTERYKLIQYVMKPPQFEMYDLQSDPRELNNLYGKPEHAALQADLTKRLDALRAAVPERKA